ncbi:MAG: hypothetical protein IPF87_20170 [Gemmatimonadetes bacterium]|jgi:hypothetical protein|nr:hypothetical protein [Gemmatimonadota bacterium]MBP9105631.1 hypothetical protein [Gemmatimonadaceae bacterium]MBK6458364.1 hypothetical protein [Gemmatimonadota bacterium]MBK6843591.1 hypothetical protein [Gemmatimonadota bacterium]MBK7833315.1 hypothetical protein [Gemmatimonadota bacterium]
MRPLLRLVDLITSDTLTLVATGVLVFAVLALLVLIAWPTRPERVTAGARTPRSEAARALVQSGTPAVEIARRTGLSRDALALMVGMASTSARQKAPGSARLSLLQRLRRVGGAGAVRSQVPVG